MPIEVGDRMPDGSFAVLENGEPATLSASSLFGNRKVVFVSVPGAFTPTCSMHHLPGLVSRADEILARGVETIACMAVNDVYVMSAWGSHLGVGDKILMLADGEAEYTTKLGMLLDGGRLGLGTRGQRFALVVEDGVVVHKAVEEPACFDVTRAEAILAAL
jgi:peroxiredoxin